MLGLVLVCIGGIIAVAALNGTGKEATTTSTAKYTTIRVWPSTLTVKTTTAKTTTSSTTTAGQFDAILALHWADGFDSENRATLVTSIDGDVTKLDWKNVGETDSSSLCSLTFKNEMFIYGHWF